MILKVLIDTIEETCDSCKGSGKTKYLSIWSKTEYIRCERCNGRGKILTSEGQRFLDILKYYLKDEFASHPEPNDS